MEETLFGKVYYKLRQVRYYKLRQVLLQVATLLQIATVHPLKNPNFWTSVEGRGCFAVYTCVAGVNVLALVSASSFVFASLV